MASVRVAWFSPFQPVESGISIYSEELLPLLGDDLEIDVFVDGYAPIAISNSNNIRVRDYNDRRDGFDRARYDAVVYQMGNSPAHLYMVDEIERSPGILVLHDTVLNHLFVQAAARNGTLRDYRNEMTRRYGPAGTEAADRVLKGQAPADLFRFPMSEPLVEASKMTIVHSAFAREQARGWVPSAPVFRVPHGLRLPEYVEKRDARRTLGIPDDQFIVASVTHINPYKRFDVVLRAFRELRRKIPARLILAGSVSPNFPLQRMVTHLGLEQVVDVLGYVPDPVARLVTAAADVVVNLRYPTAGETSGSLLHGMAAGRPVIVSDTGSFSEVPEGAVIRLPVDAIEVRTLTAYLRRLAEDPDFAGAIGRRARDFVAEEHSLERWVNGYREAIARASGRDLPPRAVDAPYEPVPLIDGEFHQMGANDVLDDVALGIAELGLGGDETLLVDVAQDAVEIGLGVGKMGVDRNTDA